MSEMNNKFEVIKQYIDPGIIRNINVNGGPLLK